ncbi:hypothetical protein CNMCM5793_002456 [Aspergillus hiratsukae]|uniref:Uncharacterized protein n=1 Tax=Aspergillus hiratsukae TaxID=1194566 RepID=A0A8H6P2Q0_9EURO|nr:hypothetical protein CNMCM5793_002456 [Aspergillus hiratsukae]KAF7165957.1 hypothetical protein CNMCM6106_001929 [Aspergillus hiratsukae]
MKSVLGVAALSATLNLGSVVAAPSANGGHSSNNNDVWTTLRGNIKHVIYLMMENHSFDNIAGYWDFRPDIDNLVHLKEPYCNPYSNPNWTVWGEPYSICASPFEGEVPYNDPDHDFAGTNYQLFQTYYPTKDSVPTMQGFVDRESAKYQSTPGQAAFVIKAYDEKKTSTLAEIAQNFAFWDTYFAEHPGPTNPNRQFATSGSTCGFVDNTDQAAGFFNNVTGTSCATSIFESLENAGISWKNYYETDIIDGWNYEWVQKNAMDKLQTADNFYKDLQEGTLPQFSYINPECCTVDSIHPTSNIAAGSAMIKHLYDAVRNSQYWDNVLIILNFDEHGGFADHVPPPMNIPAPQDNITFTGSSEGFNVTYDFTRLGVRVPAFLISPWIPANTLIHDEGTMYDKNSAYTHSSFLHFLQNLWNLEGLNNRVQWAKTFEYVFADKPRTDAPKNLTRPVWYGGSTGPQPQPFYELNQPYSYYANL